MKRPVPKHTLEEQIKFERDRDNKPSHHESTPSTKIEIGTRQFLYGDNRPVVENDVFILPSDDAGCAALLVVQFAVINGQPYYINQTKTTHSGKYTTFHVVPVNSMEEFLAELNRRRK